MRNHNWLTAAYRRRASCLYHPMTWMLAAVFALGLAYAALVGRPVEDVPEVRKDMITYREARAYLAYMDKARIARVHPVNCFRCHDYKTAGAGSDNFSR